MKSDWLIVGAGLTGATLAERIANELKEDVVLIDQRDHIGGNAYDVCNQFGHLIHPYGPHIFHTNSERVWEYLSRFTAWRPYVHHVLASVVGQMVPIPFNLISIQRLFPASMARKLTQCLVSSFGHGARVPILKLRTSADRELRLLADFVYEKIFLNYTIKQWGMRPEELDASVSARVPVVASEDCRYFADKYQAMPLDGFTAMIHNMLESNRIRVLLKTSFEEFATSTEFKRVIFTGPIDQYFRNCFGPLPYRSLQFDLWTTADNLVQEAAVYNYPNEHAYTRVTEFKHLTSSTISGSTLVREYPEPYVPGQNTPYYPIPTDENRARYRAYAAKANLIRDHVLFAGRLGDYNYYNMDQAVAAALALFDKDINRK